MNKLFLVLLLLGLAALGYVAYAKRQGETAPTEGEDAPPETMPDFGLSRDPCKRWPSLCAGSAIFQ